MFYGAFLDLIDAKLMAAGFLGGLIHAFRVKKATPWEVIGYVLTGGIAANFIAPQALKVLTALTFIPPAFVAFGIGMSGKHLCFAIEKAFNKLDVLWKTKNE